MTNQLRSYGIDNFELPDWVFKMEFDFNGDGQLDIDRFYTKVAYALAGRYSDDPIAQNGAVIVSDNSVAKLENIVVWGVNRLLPGYESEPDVLEKLNDREWKLKRITHAERDAMYAAGRKKVLDVDLIMYCPWTICNNCADAVAGLSKDRGIRGVIGHTGPDKFYYELNKEKIARGEKKPKWTDMTGFEILEKAGTSWRMFDGKIGGVEVTFARKRYRP